MNKKFNYKKPFLIAEIGINHNGSVKIAKQLIDLGSKIIGGCCEITPAHISKLKKLKC